MVHRETSGLNTQTPPYSTSIESVLRSGWSIPLWFVIIFTVVAGLFCVWVYVSERGPARKWLRLVLAAIRFALLLTVLWMLASWSWVKFKTQRPEVAVIVDVSSSMATQDMSDGSQESASRMDAVKGLLATLSDASSRRLEQDYQVSWFAAAESLERLPSLFSSANTNQLKADRTQSRLGECLIRMLEMQAGRGTAAIVFLSDGINTSGPGLGDVEALARSAAIPIFAVAFGRQFALPDIRLADTLIEKDVYLGDRVTAEVSVIASDIASQSVTVTLSETQSKRRLDETQLKLTSSTNQQTARLSFVPDRAGEIQLSLTVSAAENETELSNNTVTTNVTVEDKSIQVMLVYEKPCYEFRFLKHLLERSTQAGDVARSSFVLQSVLQQADPDYVAQDKSAIRLVPSDPQRIAQFDVFVFGEFDPNLVSRKSQRAIYEAVTEAGAGCIFIWGSGAPASQLSGWPLGNLLPIRDDGAPTPPMQSQNGLFQWQLTPLGSQALPMQLTAPPSQNDSFWRQLPKFSSSCDLGQTKVGAQVLAEAVGPGREFPVLITQYAGAGRVALQAMDETYRWTTFGGSDLYHQRYWGQTLRWLSRGKLGQEIQASELMVEPRQANLGRPIRFEVSLGNEVNESDLPELVEVVVEDSRQAPRRIALSKSSRTNRLYQTTASDFPPGSYRAVIAQPATESQPSAEFVITSPPGEQANLRQCRWATFIS